MKQQSEDDVLKRFLQHLNDALKSNAEVLSTSQVQVLPGRLHQTKEMGQSFFQWNPTGHLQQRSSTQKTTKTKVGMKPEQFLKIMDQLGINNKIIIKEGSIFRLPAQKIINQLKEKQVLQQLNDALNKKAQDFNKNKKVQNDQKKRRLIMNPSQFKMTTEKVWSIVQGRRVLKDGRPIFQWKAPAEQIIQTTPTEEKKIVGMKPEQVLQILENMGIPIQKIVQDKRRNIIRVPVQEMPHFRLRPGCQGCQKIQRHFEQSIKKLTSS